jgi:hypothetical protein
MKILSILAIVLIATSAQALMIDQVNTPHTDTAISAYATDIWHQEIIAGVSGYLAGVDLWWEWPWRQKLADRMPPNWINISLNGWSTVAEFETIEAWNYVDLSPAKLWLDAGDVFLLGIRNGSDNTSLGASYFDSYVGDLLFNGEPYVTDQFDFAFRTYVKPVPEPTTMLLLGSGLIGLAGFIKKFKKR